MPVRSELLADLTDLAARLSRSMARSMDTLRHGITALARVLPQPETLLADPNQRLDRGQRIPAQRPRPSGGTQARRPRQGGGRPSANALQVKTGSRDPIARTPNEQPCKGLRHAVDRKNERLSALVARLRVRQAETRIRRARGDLEQVSTRMAKADQGQAGQARRSSSGTGPDAVQPWLQGDAGTWLRDHSKRQVRADPGRRGPACTIAGNRVPGRADQGCGHDWRFEETRTEPGEDRSQQAILTGITIQLPSWSFRD